MAYRGVVCVVVVVVVVVGVVGSVGSGSERVRSDILIYFSTTTNDDASNSPVR